jgi:hypothetical protein
MRRVLYNGRLRSELVLRGEVGCPTLARLPPKRFPPERNTDRGKSPQDTAPIWPVKPSKENSHVYIQRKTR